MSPDTAVRLAQEADLEAVLALTRLTAEAPHWPEAVYRTFLENAAGALRRKALVVASTDDALQGYAAMTLLQDEAELESIAVAAPSRRSGLGSRLLAAAEAWAREQGARRMLLEVRARNTGARDFYKAHGFRQQGLRAGYYRNPVDDAILLCREVE